MIGFIIATALAGQAPGPAESGGILDNRLTVFPSLQAAQQASKKTPVPVGQEGIGKPTIEPMPNLYHQPARCGEIVRSEVKRQLTVFNGQIPGAQYAVLRSIDGCAVPTPVGYHPNYVLPGAADPTAKPEGEPGRKP